MDAATLVASNRRHLSIENNLHWVLDWAFNGDDSRVRTEHADLNLAGIMHSALNLLKQQSTAKVGIKAEREQVRWGFDYLLKVLSR